MTKVDAIIIGQGIAGTLIAHELHRHHKKFVVIDEQRLDCASTVAAGLINPLTGRRYTKSWMIDELLPLAISRYKELSKLLGMEVFKRIPIWRALHSIGDENQWNARCIDVDYEMYTKINGSFEKFEDQFYDSPFFVEVHNTYRVMSTVLIHSFRRWLIRNGLFVGSKFHYDKLEFTNGIKYDTINSDYIIFAEGHGVMKNPFFNHLDFSPNKGEVIYAEIDAWPTDLIFKNNKFIVPHDGHYWIGSTNEWKYNDENTSTNANNELRSFLDRNIRSTHQIIDHKAAIRCTTRTRRPYVGAHPEIRGMYIFNGLGTKGFSLSPYWAHYLYQLIHESAEVHDDLAPITPVSGTIV